MTFSKIWLSLHECPVDSYLFNPLNGELNPICHLLALLGAHHILHVSGIRVNIVMCRSSTPNILYIGTEIWKLWVAFTEGFQGICGFYFECFRETQKFFRWMRLDDFDVLFHCRKFVDVVWFILGLRCCATNRKVAGSIPASVIGFFIDIKSFRSHYDPGVYSASNRNE
jgi:hypothetical protein